MDSSLYVRPESVVHFGVHNLGDDPVDTGLQHARLDHTLPQSVPHLVLVDRRVPVLSAQLRRDEVVNFLSQVLIGRLRINVCQTVPAELVEKPPVLQMLHNHTDELRVSRRKVGRADVYIPGALRHQTGVKLPLAAARASFRAVGACFCAAHATNLFCSKSRAE